MKKNAAIDADDGPASRGRNLTAAELKNMWNLLKIARDLGTNEQCIEFAEDNGLILRTKMCSTHRVPMKLFSSGNGTLGSFLCRRGTCRTSSRTSRAKGTWFANAKVPLTQIFYLMYCYANHWPQAMVRLENIMEGPSLSVRTITDWNNYCREAVVRYYIEKQEAKGKIGGPGKNVQVNEIKFGKSGTSKAKSMEGKWVLGMIEDDSDDLRLEICCEKNSPADILIPLIKNHVQEGTLIRTEFSQISDSLKDNGYVYQEVNHINSDEPHKVDSGKIDSDWRLSKRFYHRDNYSNPQNFAEMIVEYAWRKSVTRKRADPFVELIEAVKYSYGV